MISVIMGIYNCASTLSEAIECILHQTVDDWELILCDDGSSDDTFSVAKKYVERFPERIILLKNERNMGLNHTLNRCLQSAKGEFIARMDGDDRCHPQRFEKELYVLRQERDIAIVSTDMEFFDETGCWGKISHPDYPQKGDFAAESPFCHAACMVRREAYEAVKGYTEDKRLLRVEDYHLWYKMYKAGFRGKNIHECLYQMRDDRNAYRRRNLRSRFNETLVKWLIVREFQLPVKYYLQVARPIIVGLLPNCVYDLLHKRRVNNLEQLGG